jgi:hypothetical protein
MFFVGSDKAKSLLKWIFFVTFIFLILVDFFLIASGAILCAFGLTAGGVVVIGILHFTYF